MNNLSNTTLGISVGALLIVALSAGYLLGRTATEMSINKATLDTPAPVVSEAVPAVEEETQEVLKEDTPQAVAEVGEVVATLNMSGQELAVLPKSLFERSDLVILNLSHNTLSGAMPAEIRHLQNLTWLDLSHNQFTGVPAEIGQLANLRHLDLSYNTLTGLPQELGNLQRLEALILTGNEISEQDLASIREALPQSTRIVTE